MKKKGGTYISIWITAKDVEALCEVKDFKARAIFNEYRDILADEKLKKVDSKRLPKSWFVKHYAKDHGLEESDMYEALKKDA